MTCRLLLLLLLLRRRLASSAGEMRRRLHVAACHELRLVDVSHCESATRREEDGQSRRPKRGAMEDALCGLCICCCPG